MSESIRAISLWNPHATLVVLGEKKLETRPRRTNIHGPILIHSAMSREWEWMCVLPLFKEALSAISGNLNYGYLIGSVSIVDCRPTSDFRGYIGRQEEAFGNYNDGRYAWKLTHPQIFKEPVRYRGSQGFFNVPAELVPEF